MSAIHLVGGRLAAVRQALEECHRVKPDLSRQIVRLSSSDPGAANAAMRAA